MLPATRRGRRWSGGYLLLVAATVAFVVATFTVFACDDCGANLSGVWLLVVTAPWSLVLIAFESPGNHVPGWAIVLGVAVSAAANAALLGWLGDRASTSAEG